MRITLYLVPWLIGWLLAAGCSGDKRIQPKTPSPAQEQTGIFNGQDELPNESETGITHEVEVLEVLNTVKYSYLKVRGKGEPYWIATLKDEYKSGEKYIYTEGLLKTNFYSREYDRTFDRLYLVSDIRPAGGNGETITENPHKSFTRPERDDLTSLADIVADPGRFDRQVVKVFGEVVKINPDIMERNWIHIRDGTADDYDFVITSQSFVPVGHAMVFEGTIATHKDFGAGIVYEVILEDAKPIQ